MGHLSLLEAGHIMPILDQVFVLLQSCAPALRKDCTHNARFTGNNGFFNELRQ
jgi:hypothetical protein